MKLSLHIGTAINLEDFSLSQAVQMIKNVFSSHGLPGFLSVYLAQVEATVLTQGVKCPHCECEKIHCHGKSERKLTTSLGSSEHAFTRVRCQGCKKTFVPMNKYLDLNPYERKSREFEKLTLETVTDQSFRRSANHLEKTLGFKTPFTTLHSWFLNTTATEINSKKRVQDIIADGTGYKMKPRDGSNRGEVRVVVGLTKDSDVVPYGAWTRANWKDIGKYLKNKNHPSPDKIKFRPIAQTLIADGEEEIFRYLKKLAHQQQRCLFHMTYELKPLLQYKDFTSKDEAIKLSKALGDLLYIDLPQSDADPIKSMEDKLKIEIKFKEMKIKIEEFIAELKALGYKKARTFIENSKQQLFTYIENWISTGISNPRVSSLVERMMREIKRRIKKIGFSWSERGAERMTRLVLLQMSSTKQHWENYWQTRMGINSKMKFEFLGVTVTD